MYLYSQRSKALLIDNARRIEGQTYPSNDLGYGFLDMRNIELRSYSSNEIGNLFRSNNINDTNFRQEEALSSVFVIMRPGFIEGLRRIGLEDSFTRISENVGILKVAPGYEEELIRLFGSFGSNVTVRSINIVSMEPLGAPASGEIGGINANEEIGVNFIKNNPNLDVTGRGVLICVADSGIDYLHEDFIYEDGTSKIAYIWDQSKEGNPPDGFYIGTEYTKEDINRAIAERDNSLTQDETGTGTLISGICAGLGRVKKEYEGVAPQSELVIVKLKTENGFTNNAYFYAARQYAIAKSQELRKPIIVNDSVGNILELVIVKLKTENGFTNNAYFYAARQYAIAKSQELRKPIIVNDSVGNILITGYIRGIVDLELSLINGYCEVSAIGNEANTQVHTRGTINNVGETKDVEFEITDTEQKNYL